jgi:Sulfatase/Concanavalin A-like lectin/glucanases superfamily
VTLLLLGWDPDFVGTTFRPRTMKLPGACGGFHAIVVVALGSITGGPLSLFCDFLTIYSTAGVVDANHHHDPSTSDLPVPTHHWPFEEHAVDTVGGIVGQIRGPVGYSTLDHIQGIAALQLNCCAGKVVFNDARLKDEFTNYTVALWFKVDEIVPQRFRYLYEEGGVDYGFAVRIVGSSVQAAVLEGGGRSVKKVSAGMIKSGQWHHVVATYSNGLLAVFLDGILGNSVETGYGPFGAHVNASIGAVGLVHQRTALSLVGLIDDLRIWDGIALTALEVATLYASLSSGVPSTAPNTAPSDAPSSKGALPRPNFLLIVADDLNFDSVGFMGGVAPNVTPNIDRLARESHVFTRTHSASLVCQPSRQAMLSGKYPPIYGSVDFNPMQVGTRTVVSNLLDDGYLTATFHKFWHMQPYSSFPWTMTEDNSIIRGRTGNKRIGRAPTLLAEATRMTIAAAQRANKPFFLVVNSADSHRPFPGDGTSIDNSEMVEEPSRMYLPHEVTLPSPIPDLPLARTDVAQYASSVRRLDDTVGRCLQV